MFPIVKPPKTKLQAWLRVANPSQRERLAELAAFLRALASEQVQRIARLHAARPADRRALRDEVEHRDRRDLAVCKPRAEFDRVGPLRLKIECWHYFRPPTANTHRSSSTATTVAASVDGGSPGFAPDRCRV